MSKIYCTLIVVCVLSVTGCGVRRDLTLPEREKHSGHSSDLQPAPTHSSGSMLD